MSDERNSASVRWALRNWKVATCIGVALGVANLVPRMLMRPDLPIGLLGYVEIFGGPIAIVFWFNALIFGQLVRRDPR
jgi:hypothetical protein